MRERPILFSGEMVRAILDGRKRQTRRLMYVPTPHFATACFDRRYEPPSSFALHIEKCWTLSNWRTATVGDRLWVRESFSYDALDVDRDGMFAPWYWADGNPAVGDWSKPKPSIHMPRTYSRLTLEVTGVRVERLQDISHDDMCAEGIESTRGGEIACRERFGALWERVNGPDSWDENPWVYVIEFKRTQQ